MAGIPQEVPSTTVNMLCGSGLRAVVFAYQAIQCGDARVVVAGGQESMSQVGGERRGERGREGRGGRGRDGRGGLNGFIFCVLCILVHNGTRDMPRQNMMLKSHGCYMRYYSHHHSVFFFFF